MEKVVSFFACALEKEAKRILFRCISLPGKIFSNAKSAYPSAIEEMSKYQNATI